MSGVAFHMSGVICHMSPENNLRSAVGAGTQVQAKAGERAEKKKCILLNHRPSNLYLGLQKQRPTIITVAQTSNALKLQNQTKGS